MASRPYPVLAAALFGALAGCATTQQKAARLRLNDARILASQLPTRVAAADPRVQVTGVALVGGRGGSAMIARLHNLSSSPISDLPISVGIVDGHRRLYLNGTANTGYFQSHIPAISAGGTLTWVFSTARRLPSNSSPFVTVGLPTKPPLSIPRTLPGLAARPTGGPGALRGGELRVLVDNRSSVTQYQLPVYATASRAGRYVAAGQTTIEQLNGGAAARLQLTLTGETNGANVSIQTSPTIFR